MDKIVIHNTRGRVSKGRTFDFSPLKSSFLFLPLEGELEEVHLSDLKALFFVRDFGGDPEYKDSDKFDESQHYPPHRIEVTFNDGECIVGATMTEAGDNGFFLFPADPRSNNLGIFCTAHFVKQIDKL